MNNKDSADQKIETENKFFFFAEKVYLPKKLKKLKSYLGGTQTRKNTHILRGLQDGFFSTPQSFVYSDSYI